MSSAERAHPTEAELAHRDVEGLYSREAPLWARVADASVMTAPDSDRRVLVSCNCCFMAAAKSLRLLKF